MKKFIVILVLTWSVAIDAQPPVNYLPPNHQNGGPSATYGPPGFQPGTPLGGNGVDRHPDSDRRPGTSYMPQNGVPGQPGGGRNGFIGRPSTTYLPPRGFGGGPNGGANSAYGTLGVGNGFGGSSNGDGRPSSTYGGGFNGAPSQGRNDRGNGGLGQSSQNGGLGRYLSGRAGGNGGSPGEEGSTEAVKYQFQQFETQFGQQQSRDGDRATGEYNVLLPDGRNQIVQYEADSEGYKPNISYEGGNGGGGGYSLRGSGENGIGVSNGGYASTVNGGYQFGNGGGAY